MDRVSERLTQRALRMGAAAVLGGVLLAGTVYVVLALAPSRYVGQVLLLAAAEDTATESSASVRAALVQMLEDPEFLPSLVLTETLALSSATELADTLGISFARPGGAMLSLHAQSMDAQSLETALDAIANALVERRQRRVVLREDARLREIENLSASLAAADRDATNQLDGVRLPFWARSAALALAQLDAQRFEQSLPGRLGFVLSPEAVQSIADIDARIATIVASAGGSPGVLTEHLQAARTLAGNEAKRTYLQRARLAAEQSLASSRPLRVVQSARAVALPIPWRRIGWAAVIGAAVGALAAFVRDLGRPEVRTTRDGPTLETHVHVRVIGSLPTALSDFGTRNAKPLASEQPEHLALASVRSLLTALSVYGARAERLGPLIFADIDDAGHGGHVLANVAVMCADAGQRVLVVEAGERGGVLKHLFTPGTSSPRAQGGRAASEGDTGRIRFVSATETGHDEPPVPGAFLHYFDCVLIRCDDAAQAARIAGLYDGCRGVLVGHHDVPIRRWQTARDRWRDVGDDSALAGLVHGGHPMLAHRYA